MRILFCNGFPIRLEQDINGSGNWITCLIRALIADKRNIEAGIVYVDHLIDTVNYELQDGVFIAKLPSFKNSIFKRLLFNHGMFDPYDDLSSNCKEVVDKFNPDIIQVFGYESPFIRILGIINKPICIHFQGFKPAINYKSASLLLTRELDRNVGIKNLFIGNTYKDSLRASEITSYLKKVDYSKVKYVMGRTEWDRVITKTISPHAHYFYCQEILRNCFFDNEWSWPGKGTFNILSIAKDSVNKNLQIIYEAVKILEERHPDFDYIWNIVGITYKDSLPRLMRKRKLDSPNIRLYGNLNGLELIELMKLSHLFVLPSAIENSPNALQEAMVLGMPVIATYAGGIGSLIEHKHTGYLISEGDPYILAGAILELSGDKLMSTSLGREARRMGQIRNNPSAVIEQVIDAYKYIKDDYYRSNE